METTKYDPTEGGTIPHVRDLTRASFGRNGQRRVLAVVSHCCTITDRQEECHLLNGVISFRCGCGDTVFARDIS